MSTNVYFNNFPSNITNEQLLVEDLVIESLKMYGMDVFYMPRSSGDIPDIIYGEDTFKQYLSAYPIEMYLENVTGIDGEGDIISKFGLEIRDEIQLLVSRRRFKSSVDGINRPNEGDLIYVPLVQNFFEITFVEHEDNQAMMYTLGRGRGANVYLYALKLKQFVFSNEYIGTGIKEIDTQIRDSYPKVKIALDNVVGKFVNDEIIYQGDSYANANAIALVYDFFPSSHIYAYHVNGTFKTDTLIKGNTSLAIATVISEDYQSVMNDIFEDIADNKRIEQESSLITDWTEKNPFGET